MEESESSKSPPVYLSLHYLFTPCSPTVESDHLILQKIVQIFANNPLLRMQNLQGNLSESHLKTTREPLSQTDLKNLWMTFGTGYRLSVSFEIRTVTVT